MRLALCVAALVTLAGTLPAPPRAGPPVRPSARAPARPSVQEFDLLIVGGTVVDGSGAPRVRADVGVRGDRIAAIGDLTGSTATRTVDATGLVVAPGFIDMLGQSEFTILGDPRGVSKVTQGVTTEVTGEGVSPAPLNDTTLADERGMYARWGLVVDWRDFDGWFRRLERSGVPVNMAAFVGATQVRKYVIGEVARRPTTLELARMVALVDTAMRQGALGLSTSLVYAPALHATTDELIALARPAARHGGLYATHLRNEGTRIEAAIAEALRIGREAGLPVEIWHLKLSGRASWGRMPRVLALLDSARAAGDRVGANSYPYTASATSLASLTPPWTQEGGDTALVRRLGESATRARMRRAMVRSGRTVGGVLVLGVQDSALRAYEGRFLRDIAREQSRDVYAVLFDLLRADSARTGAAFFTMSEADVRAAVATPWVGVCTDFGAVAPDGRLGYRTVHPRAYGSFPRVLAQYVRAESLLTLEAAVRKMTGVAADRFLLRERGYLRPGYFADITIFDPNHIADRATFAQAVPADGIRYVLVNGRFTLDDGQLTGQRPGRALRGPGWRPS